MSSSSLDYLELCRLCLEKDRAQVPIFGEGEVSQIFLKIHACLPVKVSSDDKLPKKICDGCFNKVNDFYSYWNTTANAEKQLLQWLNQMEGLEDKQGYVTEVLDSNVMKQEQSSDSRLDGSVMQVSGHQNMDINMIENMSIITMPAGSEQQFTTVPIDTGGIVQTVQVSGPSTQIAHDQTHLQEVEVDEDEDNMDDGCDNDDGLPVKEETDEGDQSLEQRYVTLPCDEAGPSGLQQQKIPEMSEITIQQTADGDPKSGRKPRGRPKGSGKKKTTEKLRPKKNTEKPHPKKNTEKLHSRKDDVPKKKRGRPKGSITKNKGVNNKKISVNNKKTILTKTAKELLDRYEDLPLKKRKNMSHTVDEGVQAGDPLAIDFLEELPMTVKEEPIDTSEHLLYKKVKGGGFRCTICQKGFTHRYKVKGHIKARHGPIKWYPCEICQKTFRSQYQLKYHQLRHEENSEDFLYCCDQCPLKAKSKYYLKVHVARKHSEESNYECDHCKRRFKVKYDLKHHMAVHNPNEHMCDICGHMYGSRDALIRHRRVQHINQYNFKCQICQQKLLTRENYENHLKNHQESYNCDQCDLKFIKKSYLSRHKKRVHDDVRKWKCTLCEKTFLCSATLRIHYLTHSKLRPYNCNICGSNFTQRSSMMLHWKKKHPEQTEPPPPVLLTNFFDMLKDQVNLEAQNPEAPTNPQPVRERPVRKKPRPPTNYRKPGVNIINDQLLGNNRKRLSKQKPEQDPPVQNNEERLANQQPARDVYVPNNPERFIHQQPMYPQLMPNTQAFPTNQQPTFDQQLQANQGRLTNQQPGYDWHLQNYQGPLTYHQLLQNSEGRLNNQQPTYHQLLQNNEGRQANQ